MYRKVLIVDDDVNFRYAIRELIPWEENGFEVVGEAIHGKQALEILEKESVQVVLTDMEMPIMDGVELTKQIKSRYPDTIVFAMSAYDDFAFVKESMRLGASDYLLKQDFKPEKTMELILGYCREQEDKHKKEFERDMDNEGLLRYLQNEPDCMVEETSYPKLKTRHDLAVFLVQCGQETGNYQPKRAAGVEILFSMHCAPKLWVFLVGIGEIASEKRRHEIYQGILKSLAALFQSEIQIGYSGLEAGFADLPKGFAQGIGVLDYALYFPRQRSFCFQDFRHYEKQREIQYAYIPDSADTGWKKQYEVFLQAMLDKMPGKESLARNFVILLRSFLAKQDIHMEEAQILSFYHKAAGCSTLQEMGSIYEETVIGLQNEQQNRYHGRHNEIRKALEYIGEHYAEDLSLANLSEFVGLSENYFSNLFKKEMGVTLKIYLNTVRIEKAKNLLRETNLRVYEVAELVGYRNATYFMTIFKKITGESVGDYRSSFPKK